MTDKLTKAGYLLGDLALEEGFTTETPQMVWRMVYDQDHKDRIVRCRKWFGSRDALKAAKERLFKSGDTVVSITYYESAIE